jgi:CHAD domain-containing protein
MAKSGKTRKLWKAKRTLRENLHRQLPSIAAEYFQAGRQAMAPGTSWEAMHAFRLQTKRFRYTLETFRDAYGPALDVRIELLKKLQTFLGDINDCVVTSEMLVPIAGMEAVREDLARRAESKTGRLRAFWTAVFDAPGQGALWTRYLGRFACRVRRQPRTRRLPAPAQA